MTLGLHHQEARGEEGPRGFHWIHAWWLSSWFTSLTLSLSFFYFIFLPHIILLNKIHTVDLCIWYLCTLIWPETYLNNWIITGALESQSMIYILRPWFTIYQLITCPRCDTRSCRHYLYTDMWCEPETGTNFIACEDLMQLQHESTEFPSSHDIIWLRRHFHLIKIRLTLLARKFFPGNTHTSIGMLWGLSLVC